MSPPALGALPVIPCRVASRLQRAFLATVLLVAITIVLAALLYSMVGGCYYTGPRVTLRWGGIDARPDAFAAGVENWSGATRVSYDASRGGPIYFDFVCDGETGHGSVHFTPPEGGSSATADVELYTSSDRALPFDDPGVDGSFSHDRARLQPCVEELASILSAVAGRTPDVLSWSKTGLC